VRRATPLSLAGVLLLLAGCAVGPDFESPAAPEATGYTPEPPPASTAASDTTGGQAQHFRPGVDLPGQWWELFNSPALDALIRQSLAANPDLAAAQAALRQAEENTRAQEGALYPSVSAGFSETREKLSGAQFGNPSFSSILTVANASVNVGYAVDVFGGARRAVEAAAATAEYQRFQLEATYLTLTANLVTAAIQDASLRGQIAATEEIIDAETQQLEVVRHQFELGAAAKSDVLAQESTLAQTRATLPGLQKQLAQLRNQLTALAGRLPSQEIEQKFDLTGLALPAELPVSLPSQLVRQRPDIRAAEATLHNANAELGVAIAAQFPQFNLTASVGSIALGAGNLFSAGTSVWSLAAGITQPLFKGGQLEHQRKAAEAALDLAWAQYRSAVLAAFRNVADTLRALDADAVALSAQLAAERSAVESLQLARQQYALGAITYLTLLNAERTYEQAHIALTQAQAARYADTAALFQALGGGWWNRADVAGVDAKFE
jgi:NodT family efflux transporter outer membrane factor (OMF) lipoprotein